MPGDAIQLTASYLDRKIATLLAKRHPAAMTQQQKDNLAAVIHLCGPGPAASYLKRGFHLTPGERCGDQDIAVYVGRVEQIRAAVPPARPPTRLSAPRKPACPEDGGFR